MSFSGTLHYISRIGSYTQNNDEEEIDICNVLELEPNVFRNERQSSIFCGPDLVSRIRCHGTAVFVPFTLRYRDIEVNASVARPRRAFRACSCLLRSR